MSTSLFWTPPPVTRKEHAIDLKYELGKYFNPEYNGESDCFRSVGSEIIPFLKGIAAVGTRDQIAAANNLIAAIEKYGEVELICHS